MYRKTAYIVARIIGFFVVAIMACIFAVQTPRVQTYVTKLAAEKLMVMMEGKLKYDELKIMPSGALLLRNVSITDDAPYIDESLGWDRADTLFRAKSITATFSLAGLLKKEGIHFGRVSVEGGFMHLVSEKGKYETNLTRIFRIPTVTETPPVGPEIFRIRKVEIRDFRFRFNNYLAPTFVYSGFGLDYNNLDVAVEKIKAHAIRFAGNRMYGVCDDVSLTEKSGYRLEHLSASCVVGMGKTMIEDIHLIDPWSDVRLKFFSMSYKNQFAFKKFIEEVMLEGHLRKSSLALKTLSYFSGVFRDSRSALEISGGSAKGYINDLSAEDFEFVDSYSKVQGNLSCKLLGLPAVDVFSIDAKAQKLRFTSKGISQLLSGISGNNIDFSQFAPAQTLYLNARVHGPLNRLKVNGRLSSGIGSADINADIRNVLDTSRDIEARASVNTDRLNLGKILSNDTLGEVSLYTELAAVLKEGIPDISLDTLSIRQAKALGTEFKDIKAKAQLFSGSLTADLASGDPKAKLRLSALADLFSDQSYNRFKLNGEIENLDLFALGLDQRSAISKISMNIDGDVVRRGFTLEGFLHLNEAKTENGGGVKNIGDMAVEAYIENGEQCLKFGSSFADLFISGSGNINMLLADIQNLSIRRELPSLYADSLDVHGNGEYNIDLQFHDCRVILAFASPGLYIADGTSLTMSIEEDGKLYGNIYSPRIAQSDNFLREVNIQFDNFDESLNAFISGNELRAGSFVLNKPVISALADNDQFSVTGIFDSFASGGGDGKIFIDGRFYRDSENKLVVKAHPYDSYISTTEGVWNLSETDLVLHDKDFFIKEFSLSNGEQAINISGGISKDRPDTLAVEIDKFDLAIIDEFLSERMGIEGLANGNAILSSHEGKVTGMLADIVLDSLKLSGADVGKIRLSSMLEEGGESLNLYLQNQLNGKNTLYASGSYYLDDSRMDIIAELEQMSISPVGSFMKDVFDKTAGSISGEIRVQGLPGHLSTSSRNLRLENALLGVAFTGVSYTANGPVRIDDSGVYLENVDIRDQSGGFATLNASLTHSQFKDIKINAGLSLSNITVLDALTDRGSGIYGFLRASGNAQIQGVGQNMSVNADVRTAGNGNIHISTQNSATSSDANLLVFTEAKIEKDPYDEMLKDLRNKQKPTTDLDINARLSVDPGIKAFVEIDKSNGNVASFSGSGNIALHLRPTMSVFDLNGDFNINEGSYHFVLPGLIDKVFNVQDGSTIRFAGNLPDTELDINVLHSIQTSLNTIIPYSSTNTGTRRLVECGINISDRLRDPKVEFSINVPDLDPTTKSQVQSALNTEDKIQKQFIALLLMGAFVPDESSGVFNSSEVLLSNVSEIMSGQINSIFEKLEIPLDVGIGYQGASTGTNMFDVAISTQLFNNRVIVGGSVQNRRFSNTVSTSEVVGDLDIQIKLDQQGKFRLNLFSHSADEYSSFLDLSQRNGVGVSYQKEYDKFGDFFRGLFMSKKKREEEEARKAEEAKEMMIIKIEDEDENERKAIPDTSAVRR